MNCAIITIGDEILIGQTVDTNSAWLGRKLNELGMDILQILSIQDKEKEIVQALDYTLNRVDLVIITGGLGPTNDDITKFTLSKYFDSELSIDDEVLNRIEKYFKSRKLSMLDVHRHQALIPDKAQKLINNFGSASGMWFQRDGKVVISLPGVPYEVKGIMREGGFEKLKQHFNLPEIYHRTILTWGRGESYIAKIITEWEEKATQNGLKIAFLPSIGQVKIRISGSSGNQGAVSLIDQAAEELYSLIPDFIFGENYESLESKVGEKLRENKKTLATAESCTGGYLAHLLTKRPGSSDFFKGSVVAYSNDIKENVLNVSASSLKNDGAVSESVVKQMAENIRQLYQTDYSIATSGIAGPEGGSDEKPVGTIWIAIASEKKTYTKRLQLGSRRLNNIFATSIICLGKLLKEMQE